MALFQLREPASEWEGGAEGVVCGKECGLADVGGSGGRSCTPHV